MNSSIHTHLYKYDFDRPLQGPAGLPFDVEILFDERLSASQKLPASLGTAPVASWVLARLRQLVPAAVAESQEDFVDGGAYCLEIVVNEGGTPVAELQIQGDMSGVVLVGSGRSEEETHKICEDLTNCLLAAPGEVAVCRWEIYDPEWEEDPSCYAPRPTPQSRNEFGWDRGVYLGQFNIREV